MSAMTDNEKDSWLIRLATHLLTSGIALWLIAIQCAGALLLSLIKEHIPVELMLLLYGASTTLWLVVVIAGVVAVRRLKRDLMSWRWKAELFSVDEVNKKVVDLVGFGDARYSSGVCLEGFYQPELIVHHGAMELLNALPPSLLPHRSKSAGAFVDARLVISSDR